MFVHFPGGIVAGRSTVARRPRHTAAAPFRVCLIGSSRLRHRLHHLRRRVFGMRSASAAVSSSRVSCTVLGRASCTAPSSRRDMVDLGVACSAPAPRSPIAIPHGLHVIGSPWLPRSPTSRAPMTTRGARTRSPSCWPLSPARDEQRFFSSRIVGHALGRSRGRRPVPRFLNIVSASLGRDRRSDGDIHQYVGYEILVTWTCMTGPGRAPSLLSAIAARASRRGAGAAARVRRDAERARRPACGRGLAAEWARASARSLPRRSHDTTARLGSSPATSTAR